MWPKSWYPRKTFGEKLCFYLTIIIISCKCIIMVTVSMLRVGIVWCSVWATRTLYGEEVAKVQSRKGESAKMRRRNAKMRRRKSDISVASSSLNFALSPCYFVLSPLLIETCFPERIMFGREWWWSICSEKIVHIQDW